MVAPPPGGTPAGPAPTPLLPTGVTLPPAAPVMAMAAIIAGPPQSQVVTLLPAPQVSPPDTAPMVAIVPSASAAAASSQSPAVQAHTARPELSPGPAAAQTPVSTPVPAAVPVRFPDPGTPSLALGHGVPQLREPLGAGAALPARMSAVSSVPAAAPAPSPGTTAPPAPFLPAAPPPTPAQPTSSQQQHAAIQPPALLPPAAAAPAPGSAVLPSPALPEPSATQTNAITACCADLMMQPTHAQLLQHTHAQLLQPTHAQLLQLPNQPYHSAQTPPTTAPLPGPAAHPPATPPRSSAPPPHPPPPRSAAPLPSSAVPSLPLPGPIPAPQPPLPGSPHTVHPYPSAQRSLASEAASRGGTESSDAAPVAGETESPSAGADALTQVNSEKQPDLFAMSPRVPPVSDRDLATQKEKTSSESLSALPSESKNPPKCSDYSKLTDCHEIRPQIYKDESLSLLTKPVIASQQTDSPKTWAPIHTLEIKELKSAVRYSGICSPYLKQLPKSTLKGTHQTLKRILNQQKGGEAQDTPQRRLNKALYVYNFLNSSAEEPEPPIHRHFLNNKKAKLKEHPLVLIKNLASGKIERPYDLIMWGKGFACLSTGEGTKWIPAKNVKLYHASKPTVGSTSASDPTSGSREAGTEM
ncbi:vegetative cell wall protein gp1-like [Corvus kubaryi]|uniref:vegetative cell wall protein gp1-like n=1 Tax=Corvus kubaryi TaxID=68294 RepID=UPI001C055793|nr:vegetative cell wall protein gp1-like [Corvus kubaryi]